MTEADVGTPPTRGWPLANRGKARTGLVLGIFVLIVLASYRRTPAPPAVVPEGSGETGTLSISSATWPQRLLDGAADTSGASTMAVEGFLSRFDAVIRMAEARALPTDDLHADSAVEALRSLRAETYVALRRALKPSAHPASLPAGTGPAQ